MSEIQVWEHVLKWGYAQNPDLPSDITNYSKEDFNALKDNAKLISEWIDGLEITDELSTPYEFKLLFRGSA
ncbi:unnamed protein product [Rhizophagus irregularis]|nr:unnamed protein product [Rhizophagus irregularis]